MVNISINDVFLIKLYVILASVTFAEMFWRRMVRQ